MFAQQLLLLSSIASGLPCNIDKIDKSKPLAQAGTSEGRRLAEFDRSSSWEPIRILVSYGTLSVSSSDQQFIKNTIVPAALSFYENSLSVKRLKNTWFISSDSDYCYEAPISTDHQQGGSGVSADLLLYVTADNTDESSAGWATHCLLDPNTNQPIGGQLNISTTFLDSISYEDFFATLLHEMAHVIAFNSDLYQYYKQQPVTSVTTARGHQVTYIITDKVKEYARDHFGCSDMPGLELEEYGGAGTGGSHWDKRVMLNEFMTGDSSIDDTVYSKMTFGLFEDSGWYKPNYDYTTPLLWGRNAGCDFVEQKCVVNGVPTSNYFCNTPQSENKLVCDYSHIHKSLCNLITYTSSLETQYQYFSNTRQGGENSLLDFCPVEEQINLTSYSGNCRNLEKKNVYLYNGLEEEVGLDSRCIEGDFVVSGTPVQKATCHRVTCDGDKATIYIGDATVECSPGDGNKPVPGYTGEIYCPETNILCLAVACPNNCNGVGTCENGVCHCDNGNKGGDCGDITQGGNIERSEPDDSFAGVLSLAFGLFMF